MSSVVAFDDQEDDIEHVIDLARDEGILSVEDTVRFALRYYLGKKKNASSSAAASPGEVDTSAATEAGAVMIMSPVEVQRSNRPVVKRRHSMTLNDTSAAPSKISGFAFDIGGTLCKVVYFEPDKQVRRQRSDSETAADAGLRDFILGSTTYGESGQRDKEFQFHSIASKGTFHFIKFETRHMSNAFRIIKERGLDRGLRGRIFATGGGAVKFEPQFRSEFGAKIEKCDELEMLIHGINFLVSEIPGECYYIKDNDYRTGPKLEKVSFTMASHEVYPCIVVNIGSGVSMMLVDSAGNFRRVGGTSVGGGTFYGLVSTLTSCKGFEEAISMANRGDNSSVDLLVRDIYGRDYVEHGLKADVVASSFGKLTRPEFRASAKPADVALSALVMISVNIAALAHLHAEQHGARSVMFVGSFLHENPIALKTLSYYTQYSSKGTRKALFLEHDGYFGAVGALLCFLRAAAKGKDRQLGRVDSTETEEGAAFSGGGRVSSLKRRANTSEI
eukprot:g2072.t1